MSKKSATPKKAGKKPAKKRTKVKAHWRKVDPKTLQEKTINRLMKGEKPKELEEDSPLPDDPNDETDQSTSAMAQTLVETEKRQRTYVRKLTAAKVRAALRETGGIILQAAEMLGVSRTSLYQYIGRHPELQAYMEEVREEILDTAQSQILVAIMAGNLQVAQWYLTRMGAKRGFSDKVQQIDANGDAYDFKSSLERERPVLKPDGPIPTAPVL